MSDSPRWTAHGGYVFDNGHLYLTVHTSGDSHAEAEQLAEFLNRAPTEPGDVVIDP